MGILESLLGGGAGSQYDMYGDLFTDKQKAALRDRDMGQGLLRMAGALAEAAKPTLLPGGGIGSAIGKAAAAMGAGGDESMERMLKGMKVAEDVRASQQKRQFGAQFMQQLQGLYAKEQQLGLPRGTLTSLVQPAPTAPDASSASPAAAPDPGSGLPMRFGLGAQPDRSQYGFPARPGAAQPRAPWWPAFTPPEWVQDAPGAGAGLGPLASPPDEVVAQAAPEEGLLARIAAMQQGGGAGGARLPFRLASAASSPGAGGDDEAGSGGGPPAPGDRSDAAWEFYKPIIKKYESGNRNILQQVVGPQGGYNPSVGRVTGPSTAGGYLQITDSTYRPTAAKLGIDLAKYPRAIDAPEEVQDEVGKALFKARGLADWAPYNGPLARATGYQGASASGEGSGGGAAPAPGGGAPATAPSGLVPGLNTTPQGLAILNSMAKLSGLGSPFESLLETYYKSPGYLTEKTTAETKARTDIEDPINQRMKVLETALQMRKDGILYNPQTGEIKADPEWDKIHGRRAEDTKVLELDYAKRLKTFDEQQKIAEETRKDQKEISPQPIYRGGVIVEQPMTREAAVARLKEQSMRPGEYRDGDIVAKPIGNLSPDHQYKMSPTGGLTVEPITGTPAADAVQERARKQTASDLNLQISRDIMVQNADLIEQLVKNSTLPTTGMGGSWLSTKGGTAANDVRALVETMKARASLDALTAMRQASPTGAALGNVSNAEGDRLAAALANLDQSQSQGQFLLNLRRAKEAYVDAVHGPGAYSKTLSDAPVLKTPTMPRPAGATDTSLRSEAAAAIAGGRSRAAVIERLQKMGVSAEGL